MSFFSNPFKNLIHHPLKFLQNSLPTIGAVIGTTIAPGIGTAIGAGLGGTAEGLTKGQSIGSSLKGGAFDAAGAYAGNTIGSAIGDKVGGALGDSVGNTVSSVGSHLDPYYAQIAANAIPSGIGGASIGSALGGAAGMSMANNAMHDSSPQMQSQSSQSVTGITPFSPKQEDAQQIPASLSGLGSLTDQQKSSNLATQGVYGGGNGPQEQSYFENLLNRRLVDQGGNTSDLSQVSPIEQSYLQKLGISGYSNTNSLLEAMNKWKMSQQPQAA